MKIGLNGRYFTDQKNGVAHYVARLVSYWIQNIKGQELYIYADHEIQNKEDRELLNKPFIHLRETKKRTGHLSYLLWYINTLPKLIKKDAVDVFFSGDYFLPPFLSSTKKTMTIHDVSYLSFPKWFPYSYRVYTKLFSKRMAKKADRIFTISQFSKKEILRCIPGVQETNVVVTPVAAPDSFFLDSPIISETKNKLHIEDKFFLSVGKLLNRRHPDVLINAFDNFLIKTQAQDIQLCIRGANETFPRLDIENLIEKINFKYKRKVILLLPYITDSELHALYQGATASLYLSDYEGFGLPVIESLAAGCPVITSHNSSIPEVGGNAVLYADQQDPNQVALTLEQIYSRQYMNKHELQQQARKFSWKKTASITCNELEHLYGRT